MLTLILHFHCVTISLLRRGYNSATVIVILINLSHYCVDQLLKPSASNSDFSRMKCLAEGGDGGGGWGVVNSPKLCHGHLRSYAGYERH